MKSVAAINTGTPPPLINPGFETSGGSPTLSGWTQTLNGGAVNVVPYHVSPNDPYTGAGPSPYYPKTGGYFLLINSGVAAENDWQIVSQSVYLNAGQTLAGWAAFDWEDYLPYYDGARVRILQGATEIAVPYLVTGEGKDDYYNGPWTYWSWTAPSSGTYTLEYGCCNFFDSYIGSFALFDDAPIISGCQTLPVNSDAMIALLQGYNFFVAELYTIILASGAIVRLTSGDGDINYGCNLFEVGTVRIQRGDITTAIGVEVSDVEVTLLCNADSLFNGISPQKLAINGGFDGASVKIELVPMPTYGDVSAGAIHLFEGIVTDCKPDLAQVVLTVSSDLILLNAMTPKNVYQPTCIHTLYDTQCTVNKATFTFSSSVLTGSTTTQLLCGLAQAAAYFDLGTLLFTSGANSGAMRTVRSYTPGVINLSYPLEHSPAVSDTFTISAGCDKLRAGKCRTLFNNEANFLGFEYMPVPEASS